jgi:hypothetical protein
VDRSAGTTRRRDVTHARDTRGQLPARLAPAPTVDLSLFRLPAFSGASAAILVFNLGTFGVFLYTSLYFRTRPSPRAPRCCRGC